MVLWGVVAACGAGAIAALGWSIFGSVETAVVAKSAGSEPNSAAGERGPRESLPPLESFAVVWEKGVRAAPEIVQEEPERRPDRPPPPPLRVQLLATAVETGRSYAVLLDERNVIQVRSVGEYASGAQVTKIETGRVELDHRGRSVTLVVPQAYGGPSGGRGAEF